MGEPVTIAEAAPLLGMKPQTLRRLVREEGCPATGGGCGRGKGYKVVPAEVQAWLDAKAARDSKAQVCELAKIAMDFWRRGKNLDECGQRVLGIPDPKAAGLLCYFVEYFATRVHHAEPHTAETGLHTTETNQLAELARQTQ